MSPFDDELSPAPAETWWDVYNESRGLPMAPQLRNWTCSICSLDWLKIATGLNVWSTREQTAYEIGYPSCVDEWSGLKDTQCLVRVLESYGVQARQEWVSWNRAVELAYATAFILNSTTMYHFMGGRGMTTDGMLWVANSAQGYQGVYETISIPQWNAFEPWSMVYLVD